MKLENMNQEFPKMPDAMRKMIEQEVEQQLQKKTGKFIGRRVMIAVLAATLALGTTAFAGVLYRMKSKQVGTYAVETIIGENNKLKNYPEYGAKYATIKIPKIDVDLPVYYGDSLDILKKGVGHSSGSYFPGEGGSIIYMGHNSKKMFRRFSELQKGNEIEVTTTYGNFKYKIYDMQLINETDVDKLPIQKNKEILMVYTCYPFNNIGYATQRYVVYAELES